MFLERANQTSRERLALSKAIIFISCETQLVNSPLCVDTAPCIDTASGHSFVNIGSLNASDLRDSCRIELMVLTSLWIGTKDMNSSYIDIHNALLYGFEVSWLQSYDRVRKWDKGGICRGGRWTWNTGKLGHQTSDCYVDNDTNKVNCNDMIIYAGENYLNLVVFGPS
ncbi:hypothetical protein M0R45_036382 [Rubus argutus]|uniref:C-type lectin domain-containing protein n=1 Tax=Rubus argutus TaxID=59490 RepID=A0AAW1W1F6_RUBAR